MTMNVSNARHRQLAAQQTKKNQTNKKNPIVAAARGENHPMFANGEVPQKCGEIVIRDIDLSSDASDSGSSACTKECKRRYQFYLPQVACSIGSPTLPVVFSVHCLGCGMNTLEYFSRYAEEYNFVWVNPEGTGTQKSFNAGDQACCGHALEQGVDDKAFFQAIIAQLSTDYHTLVSTEATYGMGISNGGYMVAYAAAAGVFRGAAPISGYEIYHLQSVLLSQSSQSTKTSTGAAGSPMFFHHSIDDVFVRSTGCCRSKNSTDKAGKCCCGLSTFSDTCITLQASALQWATLQNDCGGSSAPTPTPKLSLEQDNVVSCYTFDNDGCNANTTYCLYQHKGHLAHNPETKFPMSAEVAEFFVKDACTELGGGTWNAETKACDCPPDVAHPGPYCALVSGFKEKLSSSNGGGGSGESAKTVALVLMGLLSIVLASKLYRKRRTKEFAKNSAGSSAAGEEGAVELSNRFSD